MAMTPEGKLKKKVKEYLKSRDAYYYMPVQNGMGVVGIPDLVGCYKGLFFGIETKAPVMKPRSKEKRWAKATPNQQRQLEAITKAGGFADVVDDLSQVEDMFAAMDALLALIDYDQSAFGGQKDAS